MFRKLLSSVVLPFLSALALLMSPASSWAAGTSTGAPGGDDDVTPAERAWIQQRIREYEVQNYGHVLTAAASRAAAATAPKPYPFYPLAGSLDRDLAIGNYVDLDPTTGLLDWGGATRTYDGHLGHDLFCAIGVGSIWDQMDAGWPIFAALDGTVLAVHDGEFDRNTGQLGKIANTVLLDHGAGHYTFYVHLKNGSVAVAKGQFVKAGTQIGLVGSSGESSGPHLHFESQLNGVPFEPFHGPAQPKPSNWVNQTAVAPGMHVTDVKVIKDDLPTGTLIASTAFQFVGLAWGTGDLPPATPGSLHYLRPDGLEIDAPTFTTGNTTLAGSIGSTGVWGEIFNVPGVWHLRLELNGQVMANAPVTVLPAGGSIVNRAPNTPVLAFDPPQPGPNDVVFCRVRTAVELQDPDYNLVRYHYVWSVNGAPVRDLVSPAMSDAIPHGLAGLGDTLSCSVTATDGSLSGSTTVLQQTIGAPIAPTLSSATVLSARQVKLVWLDNSADELNFRVEAMPAGGTFTVLGTPTANVKTSSPGGLTPDTDYTFRVAAQNTRGTSYSNKITVHTFPAPAPPVNITATALSGTQIRLLWSSGDPHSDLWQIDRSTDGTNFARLTVLDGSILHYTDSGLPNGATRFYRIRAISGKVFSNPSLIAVGAPSAPVSATTLRAPNPPINLTAQPLSATQIRLSWQDGDTNTSYFRIERQSGASWIVVSDVGKTVLFYTVNNLPAGQSFTFRVSAIAGTNLTGPQWYVKSLPAGPITATTLAAPAAPTGLAATASAGAQIVLAWSDNATTETEYRVERSTDGVSFTEVARLIANSTGWRNTGLTAGAAYTYRVRAVSGSLFSAYSNLAGATAAP